GHEGAGIVTEVGPGVTTVNEGDHVIVAWSAPCGQCSFFLPPKQPHLCINVLFSAPATPNFRLDGAPLGGMTGAGTFAEELILPHQGVGKMDDDVPFETASLGGW